MNCDSSFCCGNIYITCTVIPPMEVTSAKVDKKTKAKMKRYSEVNWSEVIRQAIASKIREEELKIRRNPLDKEELADAAKITDAIRSRHKEEAGWNSVEEIRKWREARR